MFGIGAIVKSITILATIILVGGGLWYVMNIKADLATSEANNKLLNTAVEDQKNLIEKIQADVKSIQKANDELRDLSDRQKQEVETLSKKFSLDARGNPRDFGNLAAEKPELVERLINRANRAVVRCFEIASGSPLTEQEKNARSSSEINKECPHIANPNYKPGGAQ